MVKINFIYLFFLKKISFIFYFCKYKKIKAILKTEKKKKKELYMK